MPWDFSFSILITNCHSTYVQFNIYFKCLHKKRFARKSAPTPYPQALCKPGEMDSPPTSQPTGQPTTYEQNLLYISDQQQYARFLLTLTFFVLILACYLKRAYSRCYCQCSMKGRRDVETEQAVLEAALERRNDAGAEMHGSFGPLHTRITGPIGSHYASRAISGSPFAAGRQASNTAELCNEQCSTCSEFAVADLPGRPCYCSQCHKKQPLRGHSPVKTTATAVPPAAREVGREEEAGRGEGPPVICAVVSGHEPSHGECDLPSVVASVVPAPASGQSLWGGVAQAEAFFCREDSAATGEGRGGGRER